MRRKDRLITDNTTIESIISKADVCRISLADNNIPYIVTMNFGYIKEGKGTLYFHCANEGRKLDMIRKNNYVCFQMDTEHKLYSGKNGCDWGMNFLSIIGYGHISLITDNKEKFVGLNAIMAHYGGKRENSYDENIMNRTTILKLDIIEMTGKKNRT